MLDTKTLLENNEVHITLEREESGKQNMVIIDKTTIYSRLQFEVSGADILALYEKLQSIFE